MKNAGRNDPCPCGSELKYKKCCLLDDPKENDGLAWNRIHNASGKLTKRLLEYTARTYGPIGYNEAWSEFHLWEYDDEAPDHGDSLNQIFFPWMLYHWFPDSVGTELGGDVSMDHAPGEVFLKKNRSKMDALEIEILEENLSRHFSFYDVLECKQGAWVKVEDILTGEQFTVIEKMGSKTMKAGDILFCKVTNVRDVFTFEGMAPVLFPPESKIEVIGFKNDLKKRSVKMTSESLKEFDLELLSFFWPMYESLTNPQMPTLTNSDGEILVDHKMVFEIESADDAFNDLHVLDCAEAKDEILEDADYDDNGKLIAIEFPWLKKTSKKASKTSGHKVLGRISIKENALTVKVNSQERSKKFLSLMKKHMTKSWNLKSTLIEDVKSNLERSKDLDSTTGSSEVDFERDDVTASPEAQEAMVRMVEEHWRTWPETRVPALSNKTPAEAVQTRDGRAMVDALLTQFERDTDRIKVPGQNLEIFQKLRNRLGL